MRHIGKFATFLVLGLVDCTSFAEVKPLSEVRPIVMCGTKFSAEVARAEDDRARGLMGRTSIAKGQAMIFVFDTEQPLSFWMKNVPFDIDIGYFNAKGFYVSHVTMKGTSPMQLEATLPSYRSAAPATYAVEVEAGYFSRLKTKGCRLTPLL